MSIILAIVGGALAEAQPAERDEAKIKAPGLLFEPAGQLFLTTGRWTIVTRIQADGIRRQKRNILGQIDNITAALAKSREAIPPEEAGTREGEELHRMRNFYGSAVKSWEQEREWMLRELDEAEEKVMAAVREEKRARKTRSLLPFIGAGLSYLFGTATEDETAKLHKELQGMEVEAGRLRHVQELQATVVGRLARAELRGRRNLHKLANKTNEIIRMMTETRDQSRAVHRHLRQEVDVTRAIGSAARIASAAVITFRQEAEALSRAFVHAGEGRLTAEIISPRVLTHALAALQSELPTGWTLAIPSEPGEQQGYEDLVSAIPVSTGYEVHVQIPLRQVEMGRLELYRVLALPVGLANRTVGVVTETEAGWFAVTPDQRRHIELRPRDLEQCRRGAGTTSCDVLPRAVREVREGCLYQAFRGDKEAVKRECTMRVVPMTAGLTRISQRHWAYTFPEKEIFTLQCGGKVTGGAFHLQGTGLFEVPPGCAAVGDRLLIPAQLEGGRTAVRERRFEDMAVFDTTTSLEEVLEERQGYGNGEGDDQEIDLVQLTSDLRDEAIVNSTIAQVKEGLRRDRNMPIQSGGGQDWGNMVKEHGSLTMSTIGFVGVVAVALRVCIRKRRKNHAEGERAAGAAVMTRLAQMDDQVKATTDVIIRLNRLEERVAGQARDVENLKKFM